MRTWSFLSVVYIPGAGSHGKVMSTERVRPLQSYLGTTLFPDLSLSVILEASQFFHSPKHLFLPSGFHTYCLGLERSIFG